jgi:hypothetical protein
MPNTVKVPLLGNTPKPALIMGGIAAVGVTGYLLYRHNQQSKAAASSMAGSYGQYAYGYGQQPSGYYGYGSEFAYGGSMGGGLTPYPVASEYGYGAYGYGYYNPYTGQWLGPGNQQPPVTGGGGTGGGGGGGGTGAGGGTHTITANGKLDLYYTAKNNGITEGKLVRLNPQLSHLVGSKKPIPRGTKVKV